MSIQIPNLTELRHLSGDAIAILTGYTLATPKGPILGEVHGVLLAAIPDGMAPSQGAIDEIAKMFAGVVVAIISRYSLALLEKFQAKRKIRKQLKKDQDENEKDNEQKQS